MDHPEPSVRDRLEHMLLDVSAEPIDLPLSLLKAITNDFSDDLKIGLGGHAVVYKVRMRLTSSYLMLGKLLFMLTVNGDATAGCASKWDNRCEKAF